MLKEFQELRRDRRTVALAISGADIYYVTEPNLSSDERNEAQDLFADTSDLPVSLEHLRLGPDGFQRLPSIDLTGLHTTLPRNWQVYARGGRVYTISGQELVAIDTRNDAPTIIRRTLPTWGCPALDVRDDTLYCAREDAGLETIELTSP